MPTGYTAGVVDGETHQAQAFLSHCARAFGAFIHQRDESMSAAPREPKVESNYLGYLAEADGKLLTLKGWSADRIKREHDIYVRRTTKSNLDSARRHRQKKARIEFMLKQVHEWNCNEQAQPVKDFAISQLNETMDFDCGHGPYITEIEQDAQAWYNFELAHAEKEAVYYRKQMEEDIARQVERAAYAKAVLDSIAQVKHVGHNEIPPDVL